MSVTTNVRSAVQALFAVSVLGIGVLAAMPAAAAAATYEYRIDHPTYGEIGRYVNIVRQDRGETEVQSELRIAVKVLGIVVYREDAQRVEHWRGEMLVSFDGTTLTNGTKIELHGEARSGGFVIATPSGAVIAPASVHPSNPWSPAVLKADVMMSTRTGRIMPVAVTGGGADHHPCGSSDAGSAVRSGGREAPIRVVRRARPSGRLPHRARRIKHRFRSRAPVVSGAPRRAMATRARS